MRRTKLTDEITEKIASLVAAGNYPEVAARYCGVCRRTYYAWMSKGREGKKPYVHFLHAMEDAEAKLEVLSLERIRQSLPSNPGFNFELLKRRFSDRWNPATVQVQTSTNVHLNQPPPVSSERALDIVQKQLKQDEVVRRN